jgi:hypothetical protein
MRRSIVPPRIERQAGPTSPTEPDTASAEPWLLPMAMAILPGRTASALARTGAVAASAGFNRATPVEGSRPTSSAFTAPPEASVSSISSPASTASSAVTK